MAAGSLGLSPVYLTLLLILYLSILEFGNERIKKVFMPFAIILTAVFLAVIIQNIYSAAG